MAMPCYNKAEYIGEMFDSILAQEWDNIELILVNDGSTDGTREIIAEYEPKFLARGYEAIIVDQENAGVCAAAKAGLLRATGDYICQVDSDDELDPKYVSTMAGWLAGHPDCDFCVCEAWEYAGSGNQKKFKPFFAKGPAEHGLSYLERYLMAYMRQTVWVYMVRYEYLQKCRVLETYCTETPGSHEPGYIIPLWACGGKYQYFPAPLYRFNDGCSGHSRPPELAKKIEFSEEYCRLCQIAVERLQEGVMTRERKAILKNMAEIAKGIVCHSYADQLPDEQKRLREKLVDSINTCFKPSPKLGNVLPEDIYKLISAVEGKILGLKHEGLPEKPMGRVVAWGVLGKRGRQLLPALKNTPLEPTELWDAAGDGIAVKKPEPEGLGAEDLVLIMPKFESDEISAALATTRSAVMRSDDIMSNFGMIKFHQFYDDSLEFSLKEDGTSCSQR
jgi:hypothetical protein